MIQAATYFFLIAIVIAVLPFFPWPDLPTTMTSGLTTLIQMLFSFNKVFPIDTVVLLAGIGFSIEFAQFLFKLLMFVHSLLTGRGRSKGGL